MNDATTSAPLSPGGHAVGAMAVLGIIGITIVPLPAAALDVLLAIGLCISVLVFMLALYVERPLDFSSFPSLLLLVTLFRLALNVATTRRILLHGGEGTEAAGGVIRTFGEFAVGGNFVVGAVVFLILVIVNFVVITKGAERISEVSARFTLDSMPGKQMAIDADLGAGLINEQEARARRRAVELEADFHGAMDGASKFVRGDAIAGLMITAINIVGGIIVGVAQHGMAFGDATRTFTLLTIGDGLVSQIPALLVSTGAALLSTRGGNTGDFGGSLRQQLLTRARPLAVASAALGALALLPGMPHFSLLALAGGMGLLAKGAARPATPGAAPDAGRTKEPPRAADPQAQKAEIEALLPIELLTIEVGLDLLAMVDATRNGELLSRIASLRKQLAVELGVVVPPVHVRDDLRLRPGGYRVLISGAKVGQGEIKAGRLLAIDPSGQSTKSLPGEVVREPTFGLPAKWVLPTDRARAESAGATVVDAAAVVATHLTEIIRRHAHELLGRREAQELLELAGKQNGKVIEELIPHLLTLGDVIKVLRNLLQEGVSIRDIRTILEALADHAAQVKDASELTELVRQRLARQITFGHLSDQGELRGSILDPRAEEVLRNGGRGADPQVLSRIAKGIEEAARVAAEHDDPPVLLVAPDVRRAVAAIAMRHAPGLAVLSYRELDPSVPFLTSGIVATKELNG
ncbi:MAG: flagellar biosynthesis protein FlhA [Deltaproteobacteria bacterium]|nr:flagellar biosynthesis protein FlhA [Deltaproteobacteria bacterium]